MEIRLYYYKDNEITNIEIEKDNKVMFGYSLKELSAIIEILDLGNIEYNIKFIQNWSDK